MKYILSVLGFFFMSGSALAAQCIAENASYEMATSREARLTLEKRAEPAGYSDLEITVRAEGNPNRFSFYLTASNGYGNYYAIADDEAVSESGMIVFFFRQQGERLASYEDLPASGSPAPDAIFLPMLGSGLWYGTNGTDNPVMIPTEIWYLTRCK